MCLLYLWDMVDRIFVQEGFMVIRIRQVVIGDRLVVVWMFYGEYVWLVVDIELVVDGFFQVFGFVWVGVYFDEFILLELESFYVCFCLYGIGFGQVFMNIVIGDFWVYVMVYFDNIQVKVFYCCNGFFFDGYFDDYCDEDLVYVLECWIC